MSSEAGFGDRSLATTGSPGEVKPMQKTVVVTGCSVGVGRSAALLMDRNGWQVFAIVRKQTDADSLESEATGPLKALLADVSNREQVFAAAEKVAARCSDHGLDGLVCNAGVGASGPLEFIPTDELTKPIDTSLYGSIFCAQAFMPLLRKAKGRIVNVTSGSTLISLPLVSTYPAAKYALELLSRQLQAEVKPFGIHVCVVDPGQVKSRMTMSAGEVSAQARAKLPPEAFELYGTMIETMDKIAKHMVGSGKEPEVVAKVYLQALTDPKPKSFYTVGVDAKIMRLIGNWAPQWLMDKIAARIMAS
jgi:NAD(P)-dependent dehydrogenase (short-subunit alcohol dehydrogenase family)